MSKTAGLVRTMQEICAHLDTREAAIETREKALPETIMKRVNEASADLRRKSVTRAAQLADRDKEIGELQLALKAEKASVKELGSEVKRLKADLDLAKARVTELEKENAGLALLVEPVLVAEAAA